MRDETIAFIFLIGFFALLFIGYIAYSIILTWLEIRGIRELRKALKDD